MTPYNMFYPLHYNYTAHYTTFNTLPSAHWFSTQQSSTDNQLPPDTIPPKKRTLRHRVVMSSLRWIGWLAQKGVEYKIHQASGSLGMAASLYRYIQNKRHSENQKAQHKIDQS